MDHLDYVRDLLVEDAPVETRRLQGVFQPLVKEYRACLATDDERALPPETPQWVRDRLELGRKLATKRAGEIGRTLRAEINKHPIDALPEELRGLHADAVRAGTERLFERWGINEPSR